MNLAHTLLRTARRVPSAPAVIERDRAEFSYADLAGRALNLAGALDRRLAQAPGAAVGLVMKNNAAYVELLYARWAAGLTAIPINVRLHAREVAYILDDARATLCFVTGDVDAEAIEAARQQAGTVFIDVDTRDYRQLMQSEPLAPREVEANDIAWLFCTSGTTGRPKGVMLTHRNLLQMTLNYLADVDTARVGEHLLHAAPMSHGSGIYIVPNIAVGATQLIPAARGFDITEIDHLLAVASAVKFFAAPTMVMRLVDELRGDASNLKQIIYGGGPMYVADCLRALERLGLRLVQIYGQGECPMTISVLTAADHLENGDGRRLERLGSVGRAQTGVEVALFDSADRPLPTGEVGEVRVRGDVVMSGYLNRPNETAQTLANGWVHTGDLGRFDEFGYLTLVDRSKDLIISGGTNIYPREVEEALLLHSSVKEVAVIGAPDKKWGESVVAFVVVHGGHQQNAEALDAHCLAHIARFKRPARYLFVDELPKNSTGKVLKRELREKLGTAFGVERSA